jgi:multidrug efflux pump subunit AcrA (membrane-fusion protein)
MGGYAQMGTALSGSMVGGIGGLIEAQNYKRPRLPPANGPELRLRQLAQSQLLGGGEQLLGGTALYNQLAPILMSQLPGMSYHPGGGSADGSTGSQADSTGQPGGAQTSPMASYQQALQNWQNQQALLQQKQSMKAQLKGMNAGAQKKQLRQQFKGVKRQIKATPDAATLERQQYLAGAQPGAYDIRMGAAPDVSGGMTGSDQSLGSINDLMGSLGGGGQNYLDAYRQAAGGMGGY